MPVFFRNGGIYLGASEEVMFCDDSHSRVLTLARTATSCHNTGDDNLRHALVDVYPLGSEPKLHPSSSKS